MILHVVGAMVVALGLCAQSKAAAQSPVPAEQPARSGRVSGTVVDASTGQPLGRAHVFLTTAADSENGESAFTGDDGRFAFENVAAEHYVLSASRRGYVQQLYKQHGQFSTAIIVGPGLVTENLRFEMRPSASISGQVLDDRNEPVRNALLTLFHQTIRFGRHTTWREREVSTDDRGRYRFGPLTPGVYFVAALAEPWYAQRVTHQRVQQTDSSGQITYQDFTNGEPELDVVYPVTFYSHAEDLTEAVPISLHAGDSEVADFSLHAVPALHMLIHSAGGAENENAFAQVTQTLSNGSQMRMQAGSQQISPGLIEVTGLPPGKLRLGMVSSKGGASSTRWQNIDLTGNMDINVSDAAPSGSVSGVVGLDDNSKRTLGISLQLSSLDANEQYGMQADEHGEFSLKAPIPPGTYELLVGHPPGGAVRALSATGAKAIGHTLQIGAGQEVKLNVVISRGSGTVLGVAVGDGKPMDGVMVVLVPEAPERNLDLFRRDQSDSDGSFRLPAVNPGKYTVVAIENGWELEWSSPSVLKKYLAGGEVVEVKPDGKLEVNVKVQR